MLARFQSPEVCLGTLIGGFATIPLSIPLCYGVLLISNASGVCSSSQLVCQWIRGNELAVMGWQIAGGMIIGGIVGACCSKGVNHEPEKTSSYQITTYKVNNIHLLSELEGKTQGASNSPKSSLSASGQKVQESSYLTSFCNYFKPKAKPSIEELRAIRACRFTKLSQGS